MKKSDSNLAFYVAVLGVYRYSINLCMQRLSRKYCSLKKIPTQSGDSCLEGLC